MRGIIIKTLQEVWLPTLLFGLALFGVKFLLTYILPQFDGVLGGMLDQVPLLRSMLKGILGTELGEEITAQAIQSFLWVHPVVLALVWAHEIAFCTRVPAGEIDRGTIDILFGLPVSRRAIYCSESLIWLVTGAFILGMGLLGHRLAAPYMPLEMRPEFSHALLADANMFCVYVAVGGIAFLVSACNNSRSRAIAVVFGIVLASFLLNFVAQFWEPARQFAFLSFMYYYQPAEILQQGSFPVLDAMLLLLIGGTCWAAGGEVISRRSMCTV